MDIEALTSQMEVKGIKEKGLASECAFLEDSAPPDRTELGNSLRSAEFPGCSLPGTRHSFIPEPLGWNAQRGENPIW